MSDNLNNDDWHESREKKIKYKCPECNTPLNESMFCTKCCSKWTKSEPCKEKQEETLDNFLEEIINFVDGLGGKKEKTEYSEIEWSDVDSITNLPIDDQATYYDAGGISTMDVIKAKLTQDQFKGFLLGNIIKYSCRLNHKDNSKRDAEKIANYSKILSEI